jgi:hypothetical protein
MCGNCWLGLLSCCFCIKADVSTSENPTDGDKTLKQTRWNLELVTGICAMFMKKSSAHSKGERGKSSESEHVQTLGKGSRREGLQMPPASLGVVSSPFKVDAAVTPTDSPDVQAMFRIANKQASTIAFDPCAWDEHALEATKAAGIWTGNVEGRSSGNPGFEADENKKEKDMDAILEVRGGEAGF